MKVRGEDRGRIMKTGNALKVGLAAILAALLVGCAPIPLLTEVQHNVDVAKRVQAVETPVFSPAGTGGTYTSSVDMTGPNAITISVSTPGASIHYTTDGSTPSVSTATYTAPISLAGSGSTMTIKAIGTKGGMTDSALAQQTFIINFDKVSTPTFSPVAGTYPTDQSVSISTTTSGATIYFTTDGTDPTVSSTRSTYIGTPISVAGHLTSATIKAYATKAQMADSTVAAAAYTIHYPTYKITYDGNGSTGGTAPVDSTSYLPGAQVTVLDKYPLVKPGYLFTGWKDGAGNTRNPQFTMPPANVTLYA